MQPYQLSFINLLRCQIGPWLPGTSIYTQVLFKRLLGRARADVRLGAPIRKERDSSDVPSNLPGPCFYGMFSHARW